MMPKKLGFLLLALSTSLVSGNLYSGEGESGYHSKTQKRKMKEQSGDSAASNQQKSCSSTWCSKVNKGLDVKLDLFYWVPKVQGTEFCSTVSKPSVGVIAANDTLLPTSGEIFGPNYDFDFGFKVGATYCGGEEKYMISGLYTGFSSKASEKLNAANNILCPINVYDGITLDPNGGATFDVFGYCTTASSHLSMKLDMIDLLLSKNFQLSKACLVLTPKCGLRAIFTNIKQATQYTGSDPDVQTSTGVGTTILGLDTNTVGVNNNSKTVGLGPAIGVDSVLDIGRGFGLFFNSSASIDYAYKTTKYSTYYTAFSDNTVNVKMQNHDFIPQVSNFLGLRYDKYINSFNSHFGIGLGYENQFLLGAYDSINPVESAVLEYDVTQNNFAAHGITLNLDYSF